MEYALKKHKTNEGWILFDVGANEGQFVRTMSKIFVEPFQIYSFEPSRLAFNKLNENINSENIRCFNHGFGSEEGQASLYNTGSLIGTIYPLNDLKGQKELVSLKTIDDFCVDHGIDNIFYLKIDVEGGELDVLNGSRNMLKQGRIHFIQFEFGPNCMKAKVYLKDFFEILKDYQIYRIVKDGLRHLKKYDEILEIPLTGNFFAELNTKHCKEAGLM